MLTIFLSYRRGDTRRESLRIYQKLCNAFGGQNVVKDLSSISSNTLFNAKLRDLEKKCDFVLVVIGPDWINIKDERGNLKIRNYSDSVHIELRTLLGKIPQRFIPVLVCEAEMPPVEDLPTTLKPLVSIPPKIIRNDPYFDTDTDTVIEFIKNFNNETNIPEGE